MKSKRWPETSETNPEHKESRYKEAVGVWACMMAAYVVMGLLQKWFGIYLGIWINIVFAVVCVLLVKKDGQGAAALGFSKERAGASCRLGLLCAGVIVSVNGLLPGLLAGKELAPGGMLCSRLLYFLAVIALPEEVVFRGYLFNRMRESVPTFAKAVLYSGIFFVLLHIPYQFITAGMDPVSYFLNGNLATLAMTFVWHLVFCLLYQKTASIYGVVLFHGFMDWSNYLFV